MKTLIRITFGLLFMTTAFGVLSASEKKQPNILWLVVEDMSPILAAYGDGTIETPAISQLAKEGIVYTNVYSTSGVCAPSRAALATGLYPSSFGANNMRTKSHTNFTGLPKYEAVPPAGAKMLSEYLRRIGYFTTNNNKTDYQFKEPKIAWDENGIYAHWRNRAQGQPFFSVFNFTTTHESGLFEPYGFRRIESRHYFYDDLARIRKVAKSKLSKYPENETSIHLPKDTDFIIPPYLPDTPTVRRDIWKMYNNLAEADKQIGAILQNLKDDGLLEETIIFFYSDHGGPLPRQKRLIYDSGLKVPLVIRFPKEKTAGKIDDQLISFVDFAPTTLALAGHAKPDTMHGQDFLDEQPRKYIHAAASRLDRVTDVRRAVKDKQFKYIRNYNPEKSYYLPVSYREQIPTMKELLQLKAENKLNKYQAQWFRTSKPQEELFDTLNDPHELYNLADHPAYRTKLEELRSELDRWLREIGDQPELPESELIKKLWKQKSKQPKTQAPVAKIEDGIVSLTSKSQGASIGYKLIVNGHEPKQWEIYQAPIALPANSTLKFFSHRIGYAQSTEKVLQFD